MMVTFISQCEKRALNRTRRVLDAFANRIGDNAWQTVITEEGLLAVKKLLRKSASKNTAVSCHWLRSRSRSELIWVVGNRNKFNHEGVVPVNSTTVNQTHRDDRADWHYLPLIQALTSLAALLHDWGKASARFQEKLSQSYKGKYGDALRHEWISCLLLKALIDTTDSSSDAGWLGCLIEGEIDEGSLKNADFEAIKNPLAGLPPAAKLVAWLILTHHRMPQPKKEALGDWEDCEAPDLDTLFQYITQSWDYENTIAEETLIGCLHFPSGLVSNSPAWIKELKRCAKKLLGQQEQVSKILSDGSYRPILHHARLCLMLGDHYYSSLNLKESGSWQDSIGLIANTQKDGSPKQALDQHLVGVHRQARSNVYQLPVLENEIEGSDNIRALKKKSPGPYAWQDKAVTQIRQWVLQSSEQRQGFFAVNMASTGCGKTFANAKVMLALSKGNDSLRYILALGLRTLTLQTGSEYEKRIFQKGDGTDLAVLIGSKAIADLYEQSQKQSSEKAQRETGSESEELLLGAGDDVFYDIDIPEEGMATVLKKPKDRKFLYAPVLACTIDHIMAATETTRGGRFILPCLRLMSSDLVIDEIDDFAGSDLIAIGRLIHLAGMLGRKVMISSATIPPALAEGYFNCYREGWQLFSQTRNARKSIGCAWIDEFGTAVRTNSALESTEANQQYAAAHNDFIEKRVGKLSKQAAKRKANIIDCQFVLEQDPGFDDVQAEVKQAAYFEIIARECLVKHELHHSTDQHSGLRVSFGVIRIANITPCIDLACHLLDYDWPEDTEVRVMPYHSQQVLLLRHEQEKHLDAVLKRKENPDEEAVAFSNGIIRQHLDSLAKQHNPPINALFILVATPVEEVGRDHDFDWAIVEPSSYRSIIQLAGRVRRHRSGEVEKANLGLLQYNWRTVKNGDKKHEPRFCWPGYETSKKLHSGKTPCFDTHNLSALLNTEQISDRLDAIPRIQEQHNSGAPRFAQLEHAVIRNQLKHYQGSGPETLQGYLSRHWYLTALPQAFHRFRQSSPSIHLFRTFDRRCHAYFTTKDDKGWGEYTVNGDLLDQDDFYRIKPLELSAQQQQRLWLFRDYKTLLEQQAEQKEISLCAASLRFGEVVIQEPYNEQLRPEYRYNDQLGLSKNTGGKQ